MKNKAFLLFLIFNALYLIGIKSLCFGRQAAREKFTSISDETIQREMASFTIAGKKRLLESNTTAIPVKEIRLKHCDDNAVLFDNAGFFSPDIMVRISIEPGRDCEERRITEIVVVRDTKRQSPLPDSAFADLKIPGFCADTQRKGGKNLTNCRAFFSNDRKRIYVYMHSCTGNRTSEVTWVVQHGQYLMRSIAEIR